MTQRNELLRLAEMVREMQWQAPADGRALQSLVRSAAESVPGAQYAGITITGRRHLETPSSTGRYPLVLDEIQKQEGEGPCLSAAWEQRTIRIDDLASDARWPRYRRGALRQTPIRSVLSIRLFASKGSAGALNLYADRTHAFDDDSVEVGLAFAGHVALAWNIQQRDKHFRRALASRDIIGQAKGMLMERFGMDPVAAFELLKRLSQQSNTPVVEVAQRLVRSQHPTRKSRAQ